MDGPAPKRQRCGNHADLMSVLLPFATKRSWIKYMDESDNVMNSKNDVNSIHGQRDLIEALHKLSPTLAFAKSIVSGSVGVSKLLVLIWFPHVMQGNLSKRSLIGGAMPPVMC